MPMLKYSYLTDKELRMTYELLLEKVERLQTTLSPIRVGSLDIHSCDTPSYEIYVQLLLEVSAFIKPEQAVLDVGCNSGVCSFILAQQYPALRIHGIDYNVDFIHVATLVEQLFAVTGQLQSRVSFEAISLTHPAFRYSDYDIILQSQVDLDFVAMHSKISIYRERGFTGSIICIPIHHDDPTWNRSFMLPHHEQEDRFALIQHHYPHARRYKPMSCQGFEIVVIPT